MRGVPPQRRDVTGLNMTFRRVSASCRAAPAPRGWTVMLTSVPSAPCAGPVRTGWAPTPHGPNTSGGTVSCRALPQVYYIVVLKALLSARIMQTVVIIHASGDAHVQATLGSSVARRLVSYLRGRDTGSCGQAGAHLQQRCGLEQRHPLRRPVADGQDGVLRPDARALRRTPGSRRHYLRTDGSIAGCSLVETLLRLSLVSCVCLGAYSRRKSCRDGNHMGSS